MPAIGHAMSIHLVGISRPWNKSGVNILDSFEVESWLADVGFRLAHAYRPDRRVRRGEGQAA